MKLKSRIVYFDDNTVDFSRKKRVMRNNYGVSGRYFNFSPEDQTIETEDYDINPSVNKKAWEVSCEFDDLLNGHANLLNRGKRARRRAWNRPSFKNILNFLDD